MQAASGPTVFVYESLPNPRTSFRLIQILHGGFDKPLACELSVWPVEDAPPYIAMSYTWGDASVTPQITVNGQLATVTRNCEYMLQQQASDPDASHHYFWVGALSL
jgi:hypothetical protein